MLNLYGKGLTRCKVLLVNTEEKAKQNCWIKERKKESEFLGCYFFSESAQYW